LSLVNATVGPVFPVPISQFWVLWQLLPCTFWFLVCDSWNAPIFSM